MVSFCCEIFLLCAAALMLTFFIAGLLFICASSTSITWERTPHPVRRPAFSSHLLATVDLELGAVQRSFAFMALEPTSVIRVSVAAMWLLSPPLLAVLALRLW